MSFYHLVSPQGISWQHLKHLASIKYINYQPLTRSTAPHRTARLRHTGKRGRIVVVMVVVTYTRGRAFCLLRCLKQELKKFFEYELFLIAYLTYTNNIISLISRSTSPDIQLRSAGLGRYPYSSEQLGCVEVKCCQLNS